MNTFQNRRPLKLRGRRTLVSLTAAAVVLGGGGFAAYSAVVGSPEYRLAVAATNTFRHAGYNVATSLQVTAGAVDATSPGADWTASGLPGVTSAADMAKVISNVGVIFARGSNSMTNPLARFAITYGGTVLLDARTVKRVAYLQVNLPALTKGPAPLIPAQTLALMRGQVHDSVIAQNRKRGISKDRKAYNGRALQLFDAKTIAMDFGNKTAIGKQWNAMIKTSANPMISAQQAAVTTLISALRDNIATVTTVTDEADDAIGDKMSVSIDLHALLAAMKPQLLAVGQAQAQSSGDTWDAQQASADFDTQIAAVTQPLEAEVWLQGSAIRQIELDVTHLDSATQALPARSVVVRMVFGTATVVAPRSFSKMSAGESKLFAQNMGVSSLGLLQGAAGGLPFPLKSAGVARQAPVPSALDLFNYVHKRSLVFRAAGEAYLVGVRP